MLENGYCDERTLQLLINCVLAGMNFVFGGEPGAGKTECAKFFMQFIPKEDRVITIEDSLEIHYPQINPGADAVELRIGPGFSYTDAIKACLRQNPKWLMLSEARSVEVTSLLEQWSTGVNGFTTIHLDDLRKLPDRIQNMMNNVNDADRMENRIYQYVNVGVLIRRRKAADGTIMRYIEQLCFYSREENRNRIYMLIKDGQWIAEEIPAEILRKFEHVGISEPFCCSGWQRYIREGK
jgi:pilus assembly protein CpaF